MPQVVIVAPPRSGATLLQALLVTDPSWQVGDLDRRARPVLDPGTGGFGSDHRLDDTDPTLITALRTLAGEPDAARTTVEWAPRWSLRIPLLIAADPEVRFVAMTRRPLPTVASSMTAWASGRFVSEPELPGWWGEPWSFPLIPGWRQLIGAPLGRVSAQQWATINDLVWQDLAELPQGRWTVASLESLVIDPAAEAARVADALGLRWDGDPPHPLPPTGSCVTPPGSDAWRANAVEAAAGLDSVAESVALLQDRMSTLRPDVVWDPMPEAPTQPTPVTVPSDRTPFSSEHSTSFVELLRSAGVALAVSTYKSGHLIVARARERLDTEFVRFDRPMGIAVSPNRLAVGTAAAIHIYAAQPGLASRIPAIEPYDSVYSPRSVTHTGDIAIHDMAYAADGGLYFVNTLFSCVCRHDPEVSFEPVWQPPWISTLADEDRCHLNGLALVDGAPAYVTALAASDTAGGWREHRGTGGVIVDIRDDRIVASGLAMPHSPRWHDGRLWVLESGKGELATVDVATGTVTTVATLPGFTRGLTFVGPYALVGLSQVRESVFTDLPITSTAAQRNCGVWVVDTRSGGIVGLVRFSGVVQELFDVALLPALHPTLVEAGDLTRHAFVLSAAGMARLRP